ncbi:hypothetical protein [Sphingomonas faeni]|uniref:hypothetical protein n=2 Tax=Sphingomonas faeni TaxID=185950 RepID=UPI0033652B44
MTSLRQPRFTAIKAQLVATRVAVGPCSASPAHNAATNAGRGFSTMTTDRGALAALLATMTMLASASPATAQTEQTAPVRGLEGLGSLAPQTNTAIPIPDAPTIVLPSETTAPRRAPRPRAAEPDAAGKTAAEKAVVARPAARNESESTQARTPTESTSSSGSAKLAPIATPAPEPASAPPPSEASSTESAPQVAAPQPTPLQPVPTPDTTTQSTVTAPETGRAMPLWLSLAVVIVVLGGLWLLRRKPRGRRQDRKEVETVVQPTPEPFAPEPVAAPEPAVGPASSIEPIAAPVVPATSAAIPVTAAAAPKFLEPRAKTPPPPPAVPRARVTCDLRPLRAGLNLLSATVECELVVTNTGTAPAEAIRTGVALLTAHVGQDTDLAQFNAAPIGRPATPPFALAPGESRTIRTVVAIAREAIQIMTAANRPMFVPVVATNILYVTAGEGAQTARAWVVGIERVDSAKLAPFWLDAPAKMFTTVAARPHAATFEG